MSDGPPGAPGPVRVLAPPKPMSVAELNKAVKAGLEEQYPSLWVEGEVSTCKVYPSGHAYFDLKDEREDARLSCVMWKGNVQRSRAKLAPGERVQLKGKASLQVSRGGFQFIADLAVPTGAGAAAAALAALKERLRAEGLFAPEKKRALPRYVRTIGVVTSASGAVFHDICRTAHQRWPVRIVLASSAVQGADAPAQLVKALAAIQRVRDVEVVIIGRGGGASEDLAAFNDERVARAIAACRVPVVSAVGHEVDHTVADLVADVRASTPTMAAEFCTPVLSEERERFEELRLRLGRAAKLKARTMANALHRIRTRDPRRRLDEARQRFDDLTRRAEELLRARIRSHAGAIDRAEKALALAHPRARVATDRATLEGLSKRLGPAITRRWGRASQAALPLHERLSRAMKRVVELRGQRIGLAAGKLDAMSPLKILERGYGVVLHAGRALTDAGVTKPGDAITVRLYEGELDARVEGVRR